MHLHYSNADNSITNAQKCFSSRHVELHFDTDILYRRKAVDTSF